MVWTPRACDLPQENAVFKHRLSTQPLLNEKASSRNISNLVCFWKSRRSYWLSIGKVPTPLCLSHRAKGSCEAISEQQTQKHFSGMSEKGGFTRVSNQTTPDMGPQEWEAGAKAWGWMLSQEMSVWRKMEELLLVCTNHFQETERLMLDFMMLTSVSWLTHHWDRHLSKQGRQVKPGFQTASLSLPLTCHLQWR